MQKIKPTEFKSKAVDQETFNQNYKVFMESVFAGGSAPDNAINRGQSDEA
jgi:hypothetical protein